MDYFKRTKNLKIWKIIKKWENKFFNFENQKWHFFWQKIFMIFYQFLKMAIFPMIFRGLVTFDKKILLMTLLHFYLVLFFFHLRRKSLCDFPAFKTRFWPKTGVFKWLISIGRCFFILWCLIIFSLFLHIIAVWS